MRNHLVTLLAGALGKHHTAIGLLARINLRTCFFNFVFQCSDSKVEMSKKLFRCEWKFCNNFINCLAAQEIH